MPESLLRSTKVRPPSRRAGTISRPRLVDAFLENSDRKLLLLIAPAGYGKTTLLTDFVQQSPLPVAWLTLDAGDRDPRSFIEYTVRALQVCSPAVGEATLAALRATTEIEQRVPELARILAADAGQHLQSVSVLALDDFHEVNESPAVTTFVDELLRVLPDNLRILLAGRTLPNLTVSRLAVEHNLFGFSETDLRFTPAEVAELVRTYYRVDLDDTQAQVLTERAEGWIAGLLLSIHGLLDGPIGSLDRFSGGHGPLSSYLADEAYDRQPAEMRQFLLASSTLRVLTAASCSAVLGSGDWMTWLADAEQANLFVTRLGGPEPAYRYHPLFREFLQSRLRREQPDLFRALHRRAGQFLATQEEWPGAIEHFHEAGAHADAVKLVTTIAPRLEEEGRWYLLAQTIDQLPEEERVRSAPLLLSRARAAALTGGLKAAETIARQALDVCREPDDAALRGWALQVLGNALRRLGRVDEAINRLHAARDQAPDDEQLVATVRRELAGCYAVNGDFPAAVVEFRAARDYFAGVGNTYEAARAAYGVGFALARMGRADEACVYYGEALERWSEAQDHGNVALALNNIGYIRSFQGQFEEARALLEQGLDRARLGAHRFAQACLHDSLGSLLLSQGDIAAASESFRNGMEIAQDAGDLWTATATMEGAGLCALLRGDIDGAATWFERGTALAERQQSEYRCTQMAVDGALIQLQTGDLIGALRTLQDAEETLERLQARRDLIRVRVWMAHAHYRRGDRATAGALFQDAAREASSLNVPALLDLPARWDPDAFADFPPGEYARLQSEILVRVRTARVPTRPRIVPDRATSCYRVHSFGRAHVVTADDTPVEWSRDKARELFFYLLHNGTVKSQRAVADLWPQASPAQGKANLYSAVYTIRKTLDNEAVVASDRAYSVPSDVVAYHDVAEFDRLIAEIRTERNQSRRTQLMEELTALYSGPLLDDIEGEWAMVLRRTYELLYLDTLESLVAFYAQEHSWTRCLNAALQGIAADPDCEVFYQAAADAYRALGKPWAAARLARRARHRSDDVQSAG
jgi:LuxR family transcriptional regulator, maltose regulon positive regulatory protein